MSRLSTWARRALPAVLALSTAAALLSTTTDTGGEQSADLLLAADTSQFDPGNIINDAMFFDAGAMTPGEISAFINAKGANCRPSSGGTPCLKDFRQDTFTRSADGICKGSYAGAGGEWAAQIIWKVAQACSISPRVLLVLLQKEQGLVTASGAYLTPRRYEIAAGMGCPDTAACDTQYYGFYNQVYSAARQYQRYATYPKSYSYRAGVTNTIYWSPTASCGTSEVRIANQATAGLYNYTPYRPNSAALRAGYGTGDGCSAYGNRNFWLYFTDWFGSTQSPGGNAILSAYAARGGASGPLGASTAWVRCGLVFGGCLQNYQGGTIYWSPASGAYVVSPGAISEAWAAQRWEQSSLGYPLSDEQCGLANGGCLQRFQGGTVYWSSASGAHGVRGEIAAAWATQRWEQGSFGYPVSDERCGLTEGGCVQSFQGGAVYRSPGSGAQLLPTGPVADRYASLNWERGPLGYPVAAPRCGLKDGGCVQNFQGGAVYTAPSAGTYAVHGFPDAPFAAQRWEQGPLGYPTAEQVCGLADGGCRQEFQGGTIYSSAATGARSVTGVMRAPYTSLGEQGGALGYPTGAMLCGLRNGGCLQNFQDGTIYHTADSGGRAVPRALAAVYAAQRWEQGPLGYPTGDSACDLPDGGCRQAFQGGAISGAGSTGQFTVRGAIHGAWVAAGAEAGVLGHPIAEQVCGLTAGGCLQTFTGGTLYTTSAAGTHAVVTGDIADAWAAQRWEAGPLGYPTSGLVCGLVDGGCRQDFQGGTLLSSPATGTRTLVSAVATLWKALGAESGALGYATGNRLCGLVNDGCLQSFQRGTVYTVSGAGTHAVPQGPIADAWGAQRWERGSLGYPTSEPYAVAGGTAQNFQGGALQHDTATGEVSRK